MINRFRNLKIRTQSAIVILCAIIAAFLLYELLWLNKWHLCEAAERLDLFYTQTNDEDFQEILTEEARHYNIPESEKDTEAIEALKPFFNLANEYTSIYIYGAEDGLYRAGRAASIMDSDRFLFFFNIGYRLTDGEGEFTMDFPLQFANGTAQVILYNYERTRFVYPYLFVCLFLSVAFFLGIFLIFLSHKMRQILILKDEILTMSAGDLTHPVPEFGGNEIGILASELDHMRESLKDNIQKEQASRKANQDLITALSHDLRTPLTILNGYLEVMKLKRNPKTQEEYLDRCLKKAEDIKKLTDRMFEYALVAEETETPEITWLSADFILQCLSENCDFIRLAGFIPDIRLQETSGVLQSDKTMLTRIFNNLFSNILKYGDKRKPVTITAETKKDMFYIMIANSIKAEHSHSDSNNIGMKNVQRMIELLDGQMDVRQEDETFLIRLGFALR